MKMSIASSSSLLMAAILGIATVSLQAADYKDSKINISQTAPTFVAEDVNGDTVNLESYKGKKVLLTFFRNVGCPICNLRFHELQEQAEYFKSKNLVWVAVYESTAEHMKQYLMDEKPYAIMLPNPDQSLFQLYRVERSYGKLMKGMFNGAMGKKSQGEKLFKQKIGQDGNMNRIGAEFLIDEKGNVATAFYGKYLGDDLSLDDINKFIN